MKSLLSRLMGITPWQKEWQADLSNALAEAQKDLSVSMVVVISRESDLYAEALFVLAFFGTALGAAAGFLAQSWFQASHDLMLFPFMGFALGSTLFAFRRFFITRIAPRAIRDRVAGRAKALFYDHFQHLKGRLTLLYFSEMEREALFLASPELTEKTPSQEVQAVLSKLIREYDQKTPMRSLRPFLLSMGQLLRKHYNTGEHATSGLSGTARAVRYPVIGASDQPAFVPIPILKGSKDIN